MLEMTNISGPSTVLVLYRFPLNPLKIDGYCKAAINRR